MKKFIYGAAALMSAVSTHALAQAQEVSSQTQIEEIVVTATRREERLQDIPVTVTAVTGGSLERSGIANPREITQIVPNLVFSRNNSNFSPTLRGISTTVVGPGDEANVPVYVDGVYSADMTSTAFDLLEVERVEVLRGPQGTLFGRNATGGLINVITPDPAFGPSAKITARYGRFDERSVKAYVTGQLGDKVAVALSALSYADDGYISDLVRGGKLNPRTSRAARAKVLFNASENVSFILAANGAFTKDNTPTAGYPLNGNTRGRAVSPSILIAKGPWDAAPGDPPVITAETWGVSLVSRVKFDAFDFDATTSYQRVTGYLYSDSDQSLTPVQFAWEDRTTNTYSQEFKLTSASGGRLNWIAGVFLFRNHSHNDPVSISNLTFLRPMMKTNSWAGFGEATYALTDKLKLTAGLRYTYEKRYFTQRFNNTLVVNTDTHFDEWTPRLSAQYYFQPNLNVYASYSRGFKSGTFNAYAASAVPVDPEILDAFEVGVKADPATWLRTNLAAFFYKYDGLQVSARDAATGVYTLQNAAKAEVKGLEAEVLARATPELTLRATASYLDSEYTRFQGAPTVIPLPQGGNNQVAADVSGKQLVRAPKYSFNLGAEYTKDVGDNAQVGGSVNLYHSGRVYYDFANTLSQKPYTTMNGEIFWSPNPTYRISIWANNLTNEVVAQQILYSALSTYQANEKPRRVGVQVRAQF